MVSDEKLWIVGYPKYLLYFKVHMTKYKPVCFNHQ